MPLVDITVVRADIVRDTSGRGVVAALFNLGCVAGSQVSDVKNAVSEFRRLIEIPGTDPAALP